jgi:hypothetical protein
MKRRAHGARIAVIVIAAVAVFAACRDPAAPHAPPNLLLSGVWVASSVLPGIVEIKIATRAENGEITGVGLVYGYSSADTVKISGQYLADGTFGFSVTYPDGRSATFTGVAQGTGSLFGTWTDWATGASCEITFLRAFVPPCADSAPLLGAPDSAAPGFIVRFQDSVNADAEATRLAALYDFTPTAVWTLTIRGFAADLSMATVTVLRCEPKVASVSYDASVTIAGTPARR